MATATREAMRAERSGIGTELLYDTVAEACEDFMMQLYGKCSDAARTSGTPLVQCLQRALRTLNDWTSAEMREESARLLAREPMSARLLQAAGDQSLRELRQAGLVTNGAFATQLGPFLHTVYHRIAVDPAVLTGTYFASSPEATVARWLLHRQVVRSALALGCGAAAPAPGSHRAPPARRERETAAGERRLRRSRSRSRSRSRRRTRAGKAEPAARSKPRSARRRQAETEPEPGPRPEPAAEPESLPEPEPQPEPEPEPEPVPVRDAGIGDDASDATSSARQSLMESFLSGTQSDAGSITPDDSVSHLGAA